MIAATDRRSVGMVTLYRTKRGYFGGNVEPVDWMAGTDLDTALEALGYTRQGDWTPTPDRPGEFYAQATREGN